MVAIHERMPVLVGVLLMAGCATGTADEPSGQGQGLGAGGYPVAGTGGTMVSGTGNVPTGTGNVPTGTGNVPTGTGNVPAGTGGSVSTGSGGSTPVTGSGGTITGAGGVPASNGGVATSTGGTPPAGTGGSAPAGPCTVATGTSAVTDANGFVNATPWKGYSFTAKGGAGTTVTPADFASLTAMQALCACGTVKGAADYSGVAMIGINLNQEPGSMTVGTVTPTGSGITVAVTGAGTTALRLQIQGPMGDTDASQRWCADLPAAGGTIPWGNFQFECWEGGKRTPFNGTAPIAAAMVLVPGKTTDVPFNFCVTNLAQAM
jgi:hypothetical protein